MGKLRDQTTTWRQELTDVIAENKDGPIVACTLTDAELDRPFDRGYGTTEGAPFTAWTENRVYFPAQHAGSEWVESVPRNPCDDATIHVGGG